jgi:hypothetical protein
MCKTKSETLNSFDKKTDWKAAGDGNGEFIVVVVVVVVGLIQHDDCAFI